jgi:DNA-binding IclR family transcriptional regulator
MFKDAIAASENVRADAGVKSATRVLDLMEYLARWGEACTHAEIADALAIPKSSLTQLLRTLVRRGYLTYDAADKSYSLGSSIATLARQQGETRDVVELVHPALERIADETRESAAVNLLRGERSEVAACVMSPQRLFYQMKVGDTAPLYATSGGKAILANLPEEMREEYLTRVRLQPITPNTMTDIDVLRENLAEARARGYATVDEEFTPGIAGLARPILSDAGFALASINVAIPVVRLDDVLRQSCINALAEAVTAVQKQLRQR